MPLDGRSDLFSLGSVLFECLTGRRAFDGKSPIELFTQILNHNPPAVSSLRPELGERYDEVCRRLLAKHPEDRFRSAEELLGALRMLAPDTARSGAAPPPVAGVPWWKRHRALVASAASIVIVGLIGLWSWNAWSPRGESTGGPNEFFLRGTEHSVRRVSKWRRRHAGVD